MRRRGHYPIWFGATAAAPAIAEALRGPLEPLVGAVLAPDLRARLALHQHDIGGEVVRAAQEGRADPVRVDGHAVPLELADAVGGEAAGHDDLHALVPRLVERAAHAPHEHVVYARGAEVAHLAPQRAVDEPLARVEADAPELVAERVGHFERGG